MLAYVYNADLFCEECGDKIKDGLNKEGKAPANLDDEHTYDSDEYPKGPYSQGEADHPQHCGNRECQVFLKNPLTKNGHNYVLNCLIENKGNGAGSDEILELWSNHYGINIEGID